jgi:uncharacterized protein (TIGR02147 family)
MKANTGGGATRPLIFDYDSMTRFVHDMVEWRKKTVPQFSLRKETRYLRRCSQTLVSHVVHGRRPLTLDRVGDFAQLLELSGIEKRYLEQWIETRISSKRNSPGVKPMRPVRRRKEGQNHLLSFWLHAYVKDASRLKGFKADPKVIHRLLGGIATPLQIEKSLRFLLREGYLRRTLDGKIVENEVLTTTDDKDFDRKKQAFHRNALRIAYRGILAHPWERRHESALILPVDKASLERLKKLLKGFYEELLVFAENDLETNEELYQVVINLTPVGGPIHGNHSKK